MAILLLIDDDLNVVSVLQEGLEASGHRVVTAADGITGLTLARQEVPDLVLLDLTIPGLDGYAVCKKLRQSSNVPIIVMSDLQDEMHAIASFELGANDYVVKPLLLGELSARIRSHLRERALEAGREIPPTNHASNIEVGVLRIDTGGRRVWRNDQELVMTLKEFDLLLYLVEHSNLVLTREQLMMNVWPNFSQTTPRTIDVHIHALRDKIEEDPARPELIQTVRGVGYRLRRP